MIETAIEVRNNATRAMETWARRCQGAKPEVDAEFRAQKRLITELASVTAAVCVNSVAELTIHLAAAQALGASEEQIRSAIAIAHRIKKVAEEKLAAVENEAGAPSSRCCEPKPETSGTVEEQGAGCGCGQAPR
jgi:cell pole-organizing protein PopZ